MNDTLNTKDLSPALREAIFSNLREDNTVAGVSAILAMEKEMRENFGSPVSAGYMSEECVWALDEDDAAAISSTFN